MDYQLRPWNHTSSRIPRRLGETNFRYKDLDPLQDEIRLVRILPGQAPGAVECELLHASVNGPRRYISLSYAWGDVEDTCLIILNGYEFPVTRSLWGALQRLRSESLAVIMWADAICINQQSATERSIQVRKMTSIYSNAYEVAIWLGPEEDGSDEALDLMSDVLESRNSVDIINEIILSPAREGHFRNLVELFERDYWNRLWCVQEVFNAQKIVVYCGSRATSWEACIDAQEVFNRHSSQLIRRFSTITSWKEYPFATVLCSHGPATMRRETPTTESNTLLWSLLEHRTKLCIEPRDRVYAVLGLLAAHERSQFPVDYNVSVREIFTNVVEYLLRTTRRLDVICAAIPSPYQSKDFSLPSWVPNWALDPKVGPLGYNHAEFSAAAATEARFRFSNRRSILTLSGLLIDRITVSALPIDIPFTNDGILMAFHNWRMKLVARFGYEPSIHEAFCRTICLDQAKDRWKSREWLHWTYYCMARMTEERLPAMPHDTQLTLFERDAPKMSVFLRLQLFEEFLVRHMAGRRFMISDSGLLCLGSGCPGRGDIICVLLGCSTPVILRIGKDYLEYVGDVYVDGYMYGKAIEELNNGTRRLHTLNIR